ncbi:ATP-binding protein [Streptomyces sp. S1D4-11]|nr:ATP-binding protein [Streptomyces sp. S1D4-11]
MGETEALRERREALELVAAEADRACAGSGRLVLLKGATGTGRTALLEAVTERAAARGMRVLRTRCSPDGEAGEFAAVLQLLSSGGEFDAGTKQVPDIFDDNPHHWSYAEHLWRRLRSYAADAPLLLAVDDVHCADEPSRRWFVDAARRIDALPVLLVATERSQYDIDPPSAGLAHALSPTLVRTHTLAPLSANAAARLVRSDVGAATPAWVDDCVRA